MSASSPRHSRPRASRRDLLRASAAGAVALAAVAPPRMTAATATPVAQPDDPAFRRLDGVVREAMARLDVPGVAAGILYEGQEYTAGYGVTNLNAPYPVDADTLFQAGSITKTYTATAVMILVEQGRLELEEPVRRYLPDFALADEAVAEAVTVHTLLNHTAGWFGDYYGPPPTELQPAVWPWRGDDATTKYVANMRYLPQLAPLGFTFGYNNAAVVLAGHLIETVTGMTYEAALTELLLRPLGMDRAYLFPEEAISSAVAAGHRQGAGGVAVEPLWALPRAVHATGGLVLPVTDQLKYARFHLGDGRAPDGRALLSPERLQEMHTPSGPGTAASIVANAPVLGAGVGWAIEEIDGVRIVTHNGSTSGQQAILAMVPERQFAVALLTNSVPNGGNLHYDVATWALAEFAGLSTPLPATMPLPEETLNAYAGRYGFQVDVPGGGGGAQLLEVAVDNGGLSVTTYAGDTLGEPESMTQAGPPARLDFFSDSEALVTAGGHTVMGADFVRDDSGAVGWMHWQARVVPRIEGA